VRPPALASGASTVDASLGHRHIARIRAWASWRREALPFGAFAAVALALRVIDLGGKPLHHDESEHAWFAWQLVSGHGYDYNPVFHGPVQFYLISLVDLLVGAGDAAARVAPAVMGTTVVFLPFFLRRQLGLVAALTASALFCISPSYLYFSRFAREDIYVACVTLGLVVVLVRFFERPQRWQPIAFLGLLAVSFATKESTYITIFVVGLFLLAVAAAQGVRSRRAGGRALGGDLVRRFIGFGFDAWAWAVATFLVVYTLLFSTFLTNPAGLQEGLVGSIRYWLSQQDVGRGGQPWFYYLILMPAYEWPVIILGLVGLVVALRRRAVLYAFLVWMFVGTLAVFSWASERMPWLILHPLLPLTLLAGIGAQALWDARQRLRARLAIVIAGLAAMASVYFAIEVSYFRSADPREHLVQVQTSDDVPGIRDDLLRLESIVTQRTGKPLVLTVDRWGGTGWPWSWYLRSVPVGYYDMSDPQTVPLGPALLVADPNHDGMDPRLAGYTSRRFRLRVWWVADWGAAGPGDWFRWVVSRRAWNPTATMDEWLYLKPELAKLVWPRLTTGT
jgi:uncharacterized protein (TIGR03663 family)